MNAAKRALALALFAVISILCSIHVLAGTFALLDGSFAVGAAMAGIGAAMVVAGRRLWEIALRPSRQGAP